MNRPTGVIHHLGATGLIKRVHAARQKPIAELTVEDLRTLIGQNESLERLVPLALRMLDENPLTEGEYPGDLLIAVLTVHGDFWQAHDELALSVDHIVRDLEETLDMMREPIAQFRFRAYGIGPA